MNRSQLVSPLLIIGGIALATGGLHLMTNDSTGLPHNRNPFAVQGSAYGKLLARLSERR